MTPLLRALVFAGLSSALLGAACESPPPAAPVTKPAAPAPAPPPAPPPRALSICERNPKPTTGGDATAIASFETFSRGWIEKMRRVGAARGVAGRKRIRDAYEMQLRPTQSAQAPYVGVLYYCEIGLTCTAAVESSCKESTTTVVTEMFRYQAGKWVF